MANDKPLIKGAVELNAGKTNENENSNFNLNGKQIVKRAGQIINNITNYYTTGLETAFLSSNSDQEKISKLIDLLKESENKIQSLILENKKINEELKEIKNVKIQEIKLKDYIFLGLPEGLESFIYLNFLSFNSFINFQVYPDSKRSNIWILEFTLNKNSSDVKKIIQKISYAINWIKEDKKLNEFEEFYEDVLLLKLEDEFSS